MKKCIGFIALLAILASPSAYAIKEVGNGGDPLALEFKLALYRAMDDLRTQDLPINMQSLSEAAKTVHVLVVDDTLNVAYADSMQSSAAENFSSQNLIKINRASWNAITNPVVKQALALHEVLSLIGVESTADYSISQVYLSEKSGLTLNSASLDSAKVSTPCTPPHADAAQLFKILADPKTTTGDLRQFLADHAVASDALNQQCMTPMMYALAARREDLFRVLFGLHPVRDVNAVQSQALAIPDQRTLFYYVVAFGSYPLIQEFRAKGGVLEPFLARTFEPGVTEFMIAASLNSVDVIKKYLSLGVNVNEETRNMKFTALMLTAANNTPDAVRTMIAAGADVRHADADGATPLNKAVRNNTSTDVIRILVDAGADVNAAIGKTPAPIFFAIRPDPISAEFIRTLASLGANLEATYEGFETPLIRAAYVNAEASVQALLLAGAKVNSTGRESLTALDYAAASPSDTTAIIRKLISAGANANSVDSNGDTPLSRVATEKSGYRTQKMRAFVESGADINKVDSHGYTALVFAAQYSSLETLSYMINEAGAKRDAITKDNTSAWSVAKAMNRSQEIVDFLYTDSVKGTGVEVQPKPPSTRAPQVPKKPVTKKPVKGNRRQATGAKRKNSTWNPYQLPPCSQTLCI